MSVFLCQALSGHRCHAGALLWGLVALPSLRRSYRRALEGIGELELQRSSVG